MALFTEFQSVSKEEWLKKVEQDLRGKPLEDLHWQLGEEITLTPFHHADDQIAPVGTIARGGDNRWWIGEEFATQDPEAANRKLLSALERGVNAPLFLIKCLNKNGLAQLFAQVDLSIISVNFEFLGNKRSPLEFAQLYYEYALENNYDPQQLSGCFCCDPLIDSAQVPVAELRAFIEFVEQHLPQFRVFDLQNSATPGVPAQIVEALTAHINQGIQCLEQLKGIGIEPARIAARMQFSLEIGKSYFVEIAAIRAFKILWANVLKTYGCELYPIYLAATLVDHSYGKDTGDEYTNMIRATTQAMSAVIGGVEQLTILPANTYSGGKNDLTERVARNVQHILQLESHLDRVQDPAAGSYYIEKLTNILIEKVWSRL